MHDPVCDLQPHTRPLQPCSPVRAPTTPRQHDEDSRAGRRERRLGPCARASAIGRLTWHSCTEDDCFEGATLAGFEGALSPITFVIRSAAQSLPLFFTLWCAISCIVVLSTRKIGSAVVPARSLRSRPLATLDE